MPESLPQVLIFVAMLVPGFSFVTVRTGYVGWRTPDHGAGSRILEALYVSAIFLVVYAGLLVLGFGVAAIWTGEGTLSALQRWIETGWKGAPAGLVAVVAVLLLVVVPGGIAALISRRTKVTTVQEDGTLATVSKPVNRNQAMPRAWDHAAYGADLPRFVRIKTSTGVYIGGWFDAAGYISTYPYERDIFIAHQWRMSKTGQFLERIEDSLGVWVPITDACHVEWINMKPSEGDDNE
ncbi:DUF6338 family protein [Microbacterium sp. LWS13-1.2]|uniref:DUF6338 family protein n=1 Tax=Microbacterium sp. LWS13-1.2 TaxID=3135264 RepID=A0AAU6SGN0_9MICO